MIQKKNKYKNIINKKNGRKKVISSIFYCRHIFYVSLHFAHNLENLLFVQNVSVSQTMFYDKYIVCVLHRCQRVVI